MHDDRELVEERIAHLRERVARCHYRVLSPVETHAWEVPGEPVPFAQARDHDTDFEAFPDGTWWGVPWSTWWLRLEASLPEDLTTDERSRVELQVDLGFIGDWAGNQSEGMVFSRRGHPVKAVNPMNRTVRLVSGRTAEELALNGDPLIDSEGKVRLYLEAAANPNLGDYVNRPSVNGDLSTREDRPLWQYRGSQLVIRNEDVWHLGLDLEVLDGVMRLLPEDSTHRALLLRGLEHATDILDDAGIIEGASDAREVLAPLIASGANTSAQRFSAVGHAHIDSAWLWPLRETRRKIARTWSNVVALAEEYPDFHFACTSAQQYQWLKEGSPALFARVQELIAAGQWHVVGGMWIEPDTNLPGGESLVRQFTTGLRWFQRELGVRPRCLWLPDSFGYSGALPQIARLAGMQWFFTQKMSWNQTNTLPHHSFWWEGIDGTRIWTHFPPVDCYDSIVSPEEVLGAERRFRDKGRTPFSLLPFGYGDGGGGPVREMVERVRRLSDMEDTPRLAMESPESFYHRAITMEDEAPVWSGEMYLEFHRGVYTSNHLLKQGNRRTEASLGVAEWLWTLAACAGAEYPNDEIDSLWERTCLLQFHDILPGSSIAWVNREARAEYQGLADDLTSLIEKAWSVLVPSDGLEATSDEAPARWSVVNPSAYTQRQVITLPRHLRGETDSLQLVELQPRGIHPLDEAVRVPVFPVSLTRSGECFTMDNGLVRVTIDAHGEVSALRDLQADRDLVPHGRSANRLVLHPDRPSCFDAWELQAQYRRRREHLTEADSITVLTDSPLRAAIEIRRHHGSSSLAQTITLDADSACVDFEVVVDWQERARVLRTEFPLSIRATRSEGEIQFGVVERPVTSNTSWDAARFETSAHRWLLLREPGYGVALTNESTYGYSVHPDVPRPDHVSDGVVAGLSLLRSPQAPDPHADLGMHHMAYSIVVNADRQRAHEYADRLCLPPLVRPGTVQCETVAEVSPTSPGSAAVIDTVKCAFEDRNALVLRLHETNGAHSRVRLALGIDALEVTEVDLLEEPSETRTQSLPCGLVPRGTGIDLSLHPYQILTLKVVYR